MGSQQNFKTRAPVSRSFDNLYSRPEPREPRTEYGM